LFPSNIILLVLLISLDNDSFQSFAANFIVRVLTLKGLIETDTLYLVFKDRVLNGLGLKDYL